MSVERGWYKDPSNPEQNRWWDGTSWTAHTSAPEPAATPAQAVAAPSAPAAAKPAKRVKSVKPLRGRKLSAKLNSQPLRPTENSNPPLRKSVNSKKSGVFSKVMPVLILTVFLVVVAGAVTAVVTSIQSGGAGFTESTASEAPELPEGLKPIPNLGVLDKAQDVADEAQAKADGEQAIVDQIPTDEPSAAPDNVFYPNCTAVERAGKAPISEGDPGWQSKFDHDGDGVGCEQPKK